MVLISSSIPSRETSFVISERLEIDHSEENLFHIFSLFDKGISTESIPIKAFPLNIKGNMELSKDVPPTNPLQAIAPPGLRAANKVERTSPPTTSTPISHNPLLMGFFIFSIDLEWSPALGSFKMKV